MSDLREQIAKRLAALVKSVDGIAGLSDYENACELARADEVIRLMEWAQHLVGVSGPTTIESTELRLGEIVPTTKIISPAVPYRSPLTLPPPEWKP